jgi:hypothetical protein
VPRNKQNSYEEATDRDGDRLSLATASNRPGQKMKDDKKQDIPGNNVERQNVGSARTTKQAKKHARQGQPRLPRYDEE